MNKKYEPAGPYYLILAYENMDVENVVETAYIDGIKTEAEAWRQCCEIDKANVEAIDARGEALTLTASSLLHVTITKAADDFLSRSYAA